MPSCVAWKKDKRQVCEKLQVSEDALQSVHRDLAHQKRMHDAATTRLLTRIDDLQS